jgi:hypothetical protein
MKYGALLVIIVGSGSAFAQAPGASIEQPEPPQAQPEPPQAQPMQPQAQPMQPMQPPQAPTRATFVSTSEQQWEVTIDRQPACSTPCTLPIMPLQFIALRSHERNPIRLDVGYMPAGDLMVTAKPLSNGMYATGIVFTSFSGMALVTGITLTAVGCSTDRSGMCTAGLITGGAGAIGLYGSIYLMRKALPKASIGPARPYVAGNQVGLAGAF